ncbi:hypothetical protein TRIUR3_30441 [Triticum urartu]|uniref:Uncharacterized protein n=1 Tax=Triticum urartu TaxID=4572 RepID=M7Z9Q2_TRIUA|nr:hypothetical protein TRIUR3_30441 [Triticum urartu]
MVAWKAKELEGAGAMALSDELLLLDADIGSQGTELEEDCTPAVEDERRRRDTPVGSTARGRQRMVAGAMQGRSRGTPGEARSSPATWRGLSAGAPPLVQYGREEREMMGGKSEGIRLLSLRARRRGSENMAGRQSRRGSSDPPNPGRARRRRRHSVEKHGAATAMVARKVKLVKELEGAGAMVLSGELLLLDADIGSQGTELEEDSAPAIEDERRRRDTLVGSRARGRQRKVAGAMQGRGRDRCRGASAEARSSPGLGED